MAVGFAVGGGCSRDVRLADRDVRSVTVQAVTHYGTVLDKQASPEQVTYVLLRAIRDDFMATTPEERKAALDKQFDICAANVIRVKNRSALTGDEYAYYIVYNWTPTVSHYVDNFETAWERAKARFVRGSPRLVNGADADATECEVLMELEDPSGDPSARVVMIVWLAQDSGFWRVVHLGFDPTRRSIEN
ncbi:MAG: hypothetical protein WBE26_08425 [Phycisphaerae bacterium]